MAEIRAPERGLLLPGESLFGHSRSLAVSVLNYSEPFREAFSVLERRLPLNQN